MAKVLGESGRYTSHEAVKQRRRIIIVEKNFGKGLKADDAQQIAQAFLGLAHMDRDFGKIPNEAKPQNTKNLKGKSPVESH